MSVVLLSTRGRTQPNFYPVTWRV